MPDRDLPAFDCYAVLGVPVTATVAEIERAFRAAAMREHPDRRASIDGEPAAATLRMQRLNVARDWLTDPDRRARYDAARAVMSGGGVVVDLPDMDRLDDWPAAIGTERRGSMLGPTMASLAMMVLITLMFVGSASLVVAVIAVGAVAVLVVGVLITIIGALR